MACILGRRQGIFLHLMSTPKQKKYPQNGLTGVLVNIKYLQYSLFIIYG